MWDESDVHVSVRAMQASVWIYVDHPEIPPLSMLLTTSSTNILMTYWRITRVNWYKRSIKVCQPQVSGLMWTVIWLGFIVCHTLSWHQTLLDVHLGLLMRRSWRMSRPEMTMPLMCYRSVKMICGLCMRTYSLGCLRDMAMMRLSYHVTFLPRHIMPWVIGDRGGSMRLGLSIHTWLCFYLYFGMF